MNDQVLVRLKRARGQLDAVIRMYEGHEGCSEIVTQVAAVRAALAGVGKEMLTSEAVSCARNQDHDKLDKLMKKLFKFS